MKPLALPLAIAGALLIASPCAATVNSLTSLPANFSWSYFGGALAIAPIHAVNFITPPGAAGAIQTISAPIYAADNGPPDGDVQLFCNGSIRCEQIGNVQFQYAIWKGVAGHQSTPNRVGAILFGGFQLTDTTDINANFSFLQTYADNSAPAGVIDGGNYQGKVNTTIPGYQSNPGALTGGWNYTGNSPQYQFFDVPYDFSPGSPLETVSFETALANTDPATGTVTVLADFTWGFSTLTGLTRQPIAFGPATSPTLLSLYATAFPGVRYVDGILSPSGPVPEPAAWSLLLFGFLGTGAGLRRRLAARAARTPGITNR